MQAGLVEQGIGFAPEADRDWVVLALNDNLPLNDFITWQLAGDLLPNPTLAQRVATTTSTTRSRKKNTTGCWPSSTARRKTRWTAMPTSTAPWSRHRRTNSPGEIGGPANLHAMDSHRLPGPRPKNLKTCLPTPLRETGWDWPAGLPGANILHLMGLDHKRLTYRYQGRDFRLTDVHGHVIRDLMA